MSPPNFYQLLLLLIFFSSLSISSIPSSSSSSLSTFAISHISNTTLLVCALLPSPNNQYDLNCTSFPNGTTTHHYPSGAHPYSAVAAGDGFLCGLTSPTSSNTSTMKWWDFAHNPNRSSIPDTKRVYKGPTVLDLSSGDYHVCGLTGGARAVNCWRWPQLEIPQGLNLTQIAVGGRFVCGLEYSGKIACFGGDGGGGVVGNEPGGNFTALAAGSTHACGVSVNGELNCWGIGAPNPNMTKNVPSIAAMALGENRTCVLDFNGAVHCWGRNFRLPENVATSPFVAIQARGNSFCGVLMTNFSLVCWGNEKFHQNNVAFKLVLPGTCMSKCPCQPLAGTGTLCPNGLSVCAPCPVLSLSQNPNLNLNPPTYYRSSSSSNRSRLIFIILGSTGLFFGLIAAVCYLLLKFKLKYGRIHNSAINPPTVRPVPQPNIESQLSQLFNKGHSSTVEEFPIRHLLAITNGFSDDHKIGSGSFGSVYRAMLDDGRIVAVKRAKPSAPASNTRRQDKESAFCTELALLSRVNHKNVVRLLGFCKEGAERILVYEFISNGTLHDLLHKSGCELGSPLGSWAARIRVALDAARGVEYLHSYAVPPIIHRDIKSSNILLDEDWTAKVSDFGLSLLIPETSFVVDDLSNVSPSTAGTVGYMDPEYYRLQHLTAKSDVYSFGVVLLEILSGCKVIKKYGESGTPKNVVEFALPHIVFDDIDRVLDARLAPPTESETEALAFVGYLAADCVSPEGRDRPTMSEIVSGLERALTIISSQASSSSTIID